MRILTKRNLMLGNMALGFIFLLVAFFAVRPLFQAGGAIDVVTVGGGGPPRTGSGMEAERERYEAMKSQYPQVIGVNNIFVPKVPKPAVVVVAKKLDPLVPPPWTFVGAYSPDGEGKTWIAYIREGAARNPRDPRPTTAEDIRVEVGQRFPKYMVVITEVTADYVRYEIRDDENFRSEEHFVPVEAAKRATKLDKDWSGIIVPASANSYVVDMIVFEKELKILAGPEGDWVMTLVNSVEAEQYRPGAEDAPLQGYRVLAFKPESPLNELGLERQDVIIGLGGKPITDPDHGLEMLREALAGNEIKLHVTRSGRDRYIQIKLNRFE
ncbi:MAG: PDZ domain-containing protein [Verrucomicrobia bacterium]|nr:PDZ domain-containing protein [Verrucomicrobiota bacterium]